MRAERSDIGGYHNIQPEETRFWSHVLKTEGCWLWQSTITFGYGYFKLSNQGDTVRAHKYSWELVNGKVPENMELHHECKNRCCVRPDHLILTTRANHPNQVCELNRNKTHCKNGHEFTEENTIVANGSRRCRICRDNYNKSYKNSYGSHRWSQ